MPTCGQASFIRAMPEKEKPPAMRVDIYCQQSLRKASEETQLEFSIAQGKSDWRKQSLFLP